MGGEDDFCPIDTTVSDECVCVCEREKDNKKKTTDLVTHTDRRTHTEITQ